MENGPTLRFRLLALAFLFEGGLGALAWVLGGLLDKPPLADVEWNARAVVQGVAASIPLVHVFLVLVYVPLPALRALRQLLDEVLRPLFHPCTLLDLAVVSLLAGVGEEMLFRGVLQAVLSDWLGIGPGLATASLLFGLMHAITRTYVVIATVFGIYLGAIWLATGNLVVPILAHALYDFLVLAYLLRWEGAPREESAKKAVPGPQDDGGQ